MVSIWVVVFVLFVVEDYVGGVKVGEVVKIDSSDGDLFTAWIVRMFYAMFLAVAVKGDVSFSAPDDTGTVRTFDVKKNLNPIHGVTSHIFNTHGCSSGVRIRLGTGSTAPSRTNNRLVSEIAVIGSPAINIDEGRGFVFIEGTITFPSDTTICEVGLSLYGTVAGDGTCGEFLLDRTVFSPCRVIPADTPYTVRYRVQL
jgi:hypothetical protein